MVVQPTADMQVGGSIPGWTAIAVTVVRPGFEPRTCTPALAALPLDRCLFCSSCPPLEAESATEKKTKLCNPVCLPACPTDCLTDCWPE